MVTLTRMNILLNRRFLLIQLAPALVGRVVNLQRPANGVANPLVDLRLAVQRG
jgi:hypothetical protein